MSNYRILIYRDIEIEYIPIEDSPEYTEVVKEIGEPHITSVDNDEDAERLLSEGAWEMPKEEATSTFGDKIMYVTDLTCSISGDKEKGYKVTFNPPQDLTEEELLNKAKHRKQLEAEQALTKAIDSITPYYPTDEKVTFDKQEKEALKFLDNPEIDKKEIPHITNIAKYRQIPLIDLVKKIKEKSDLFSSLSGMYLGKKQRVQDLVNKAKSVKEVEDINVQEIFTNNE